MIFGRNGIDGEGVKEVGKKFGEERVGRRRKGGEVLRGVQFGNIVSL